MDLVRIVDESIDKLPSGEHSLGLKAVRRHIAAAIRHFENKAGADADCFTDAIYRTNQAFEGGLKEAYRVLAGKDPAKLTPFQIESYLEENEIIRPRALKQLTRYREDYRNPSTHDYKLDFDSDEALLAIVSVCAFSKLLADQIGFKLASNEASDAATPVALKDGDVGTFAATIASILKDALPKQIHSSGVQGFQGFIDGVLRGSGFTTNPVFDNDGENPDEPWDNLISSGTMYVPVETRAIASADLKVSMEYIINSMRLNALTRCVLALYMPDEKGAFRVYEHSFDNGSKVLLVSQKPVSTEVRETNLAALQTYFDFKI
jgi:hypothetical protein